MNMFYMLVGAWLGVPIGYLLCALLSANSNKDPTKPDSD